MADGENSGLWGDITNDNLEILGRAISGVTTLALAGTTTTLSTLQGTLSEGHFAVLELGGSPTGTNTITITPNTIDRIYMVKNNSGQAAVFTQGSGGSVTVANGNSAIIFCNGAGSTAKVTELTEGFLRGVNNLSEVSDPAAALTNLGLTATAAEINTLDGFTGTVADFNYAKDLRATGVTTAEFDKLDGLTATTAELNITDGLTASTAELNTMDGITATTAELNTLDGVDTSGAGFGYIPQGGIILWSGSIASIPTGFALCDGASGTPDLRDRFVVGAGSTYNPNDTGGANSVTLTEAQMPSHTHTGTADSTALDGTIGRTADDQLDQTGGVFTQTATASGNLNAASAGAINAFVTSFDGAHGHSLTISSTGGDASHENRPPYYALAYIMKL
jgi:microcystin-dependent protein